MIFFLVCYLVFRSAGLFAHAHVDFVEGGTCIVLIAGSCGAGSPAHAVYSVHLVSGLMCSGEERVGRRSSLMRLLLLVHLVLA
jgi:hypothetical protein